MVKISRIEQNLQKPRNFHPSKLTCYTVLNFKAVGQTQAELHDLKIEKLDACITPFFQVRSHMYYRFYVKNKISLKWEVLQV